MASYEGRSSARTSRSSLKGKNTQVSMQSMQPPPSRPRSTSYRSVTSSGTVQDEGHDQFGNSGETLCPGAVENGGPSTAAPTPATTFPSGHAFGSLTSYGTLPMQRQDGESQQLTRPSSIAPSTTSMSHHEAGYGAVQQLPPRWESNNQAPLIVQSQSEISPSSGFPNMSQFAQCGEVQRPEVNNVNTASINTQSQVNGLQPRPSTAQPQEVAAGPVHGDPMSSGVASPTQSGPNGFQNADIPVQEVLQLLITASRSSPEHRIEVRSSVLQPLIAGYFQQREGLAKFASSLGIQ